jgi:hypothetical protein
MPTPDTCILPLLVSSALNAAIVGAVLGPLCRIVVLVALMAERGHSGQSGRVT